MAQGGMEDWWPHPLVPLMLLTCANGPLLMVPGTWKTPCLDHLTWTTLLWTLWRAPQFGYLGLLPIALGCSWSTETSMSFLRHQLRDLDSQWDQHVHELQQSQQGPKSWCVLPVTAPHTTSPRASSNCPSQVPTNLQHTN